MKTATLCALVFASSLLPLSCAPAPEAAMDQATVLARYSSVRMKNSSTSRTLKTLEPGDRIEVLEKQDDWYRIRLGDLVGWMQESTIVTDATKALIQESVAASQGEMSQNTAVLSNDGNLRIEPGRSTPVIRKLNAGTPVEVLDRKTLPRDNAPDRLDVWLKLRPTPTEVGWVLASLVRFDVPAEIAQYTEDYVYAAVKPLNQVQDSIAGPIQWYVVGERRPGMDPNLDFNGIRVFTWNNRKHRYETAYRVRGLRGVYPLEVGQNGGKPTFRIHELGEDGKTKTARDFIMNGVLVSEVSKDSD